MSGTLLDPDRLFRRPARARAGVSFTRASDLPIVSPHGHTDPSWFAQDTAFADPASLFLTPDHYVLRCRRGVSYDR